MVDIQQPQVEKTFAQPLQTLQAPQSWPAAQARPVLPVYSVEERVRKRRLRVVVARVLSFVFDALMINLAFLTAYYIRYEALHGVTFTTPYVDVSLDTFRQLQIAVTIGILAAFYLKGLYGLRSSGTWLKQVWIIASATTTAFALFSAFDYVVRKTDIAVDQSRSLVTFTWIAIIVIISFYRLVVSGIVSYTYQRGIGLSNMLVVGSGRLGKLMMQQVAATPSLGYKIIGFIDDQDGPPTDFGRFKALGSIADLDKVIRGQRVSDVVIALPSYQHQLILKTVRICERAGADFKLLPDLYELSLARINVDAIEGVPLIGLRRGFASSWQYALKRALDIVGASLVLLVGAPIWLLVALAIKLDSPGPVLFSQPRIGYRGEPFQFLKFRSMHVNAEKIVEKLRAEHPEKALFKDRHDPRRTRVGRFIRPTSIDEIPQMINVLRGEMSLIGPRPLPPYESENYDEWERGRFEMRPGLTGLWQVRGRSNITFDEMILMDLYYIENWSLRLDLQIMLRTPAAVLLRRGAY